MQLIITVRYTGVLGKYKAEKCRDFSIDEIATPKQNNLSQWQIRHRAERVETDLIVATSTSLIYYVRLHE